jgi:hypothetical protein
MSSEEIVVVLPEGGQCAAEAADGSLSCILPTANLDGWHAVFGGHLGRDGSGAYWGWSMTGGAEAVRRTDLTQAD